jgi:hypothetical protein
MLKINRPILTYEDIKEIVLEFDTEKEAKDFYLLLDNPLASIENLKQIRITKYFKKGVSNV